MTTLTYALQVLSALPQLLAAGVDIVAFVQKSLAKVDEMRNEGREPTTAEWDELNAEIARLRGELHS